jgi:predicted dienelactone hydrolase
MTHADSLQYKKSQAARDSLMTKSVTEFSNALDRPKEVSFVIDSFSKLEQEIPSLKGRLDASQIGIGGHSFGAHTSMICAGTMSSTGASYPEKRAKAFLLMSPQGVGGALNEKSWSKIASPMMVVSGTKDGSNVGRTVTPEHRRDPYTYSPAGDKYLLWMEGANHGLGGVARSGEAKLKIFNKGSNPDQLKTVQAVSLAFFDAYVKGDKAALNWLKTKDLSSSLPAKSDFLWK